MIVYKYLRKEHLLKFKADGSIHVNTFNRLREIEHELIRDELEGLHSLKISSNKQSVRFSGKEFHTMIPVLKMNEQQEKKVTVDIENGAQFNMQIANAFVFCTSLKLDDSLFRRFGVDAYYKIAKLYDFASVLFEKLNEVLTIRCYKADVVKYLDKPITITNSSKKQVLAVPQDYWSVCFTKPKRFREEQEFRMVFVPEFPKEIEPITIKCPDLRKYCVFDSIV